MNYAILGGGLSAISLAYYLQENKNIDEIHILEKDEVLGGICRTYVKDGIEYDVGPHIIFSKDKEILDLIYDLKHRSNMDKIKEYFKSQGIYLNGRFGSFEYLNMDAIINQSKVLAQNIKESYV